MYKLFFMNGPEALSVAFYLAMGWMVSFIAKPVWEQASGHLLAWIIAGGLFYTAGVFFYLKAHRVFFHAIWHLFVFAGTVCHGVFVYLLYQ
jgi:hemolysin III